MLLLCVRPCGPPNTTRCSLSLSPLLARDEPVPDRSLTLTGSSTLAFPRSLSSFSIAIDAPNMVSRSFKLELEYALSLPLLALLSVRWRGFNGGMGGGGDATTGLPALPAVLTLWLLDRAYPNPASEVDVEEYVEARDGSRICTLRVAEAIDRERSIDPVAATDRAGDLRPPAGFAELSLSSSVPSA